MLGFEQQRKFFRHILKQKTLVHAYLFSGPEMIGKRTFALELAKDINLNMSESWTQDVLLIDQDLSEKEQAITIAQIRDLKRFVSLSASSHGHKVIIINNAHRMTKEAQNALLKVLEEPAPKTVFLLVSDRPSRLLPTVVSRLQDIGFGPHPRAVFEELFAQMSLSNAQKDFLFLFCQGRLGLAKELMTSGSLQTLRPIMKELQDLSNESLYDRLEHARELTTAQSHAGLKLIVWYWLLYITGQARKDIKQYRLARKLLDLYRNIEQPSFNTQMAIENFVISI